MKKLKEILFLSDKGYTDLKKAIIACTITNLAMLLPFCITVMVFSELLNPFLGQELDWQNIWLLWGAGIISAIIVFLASKNDYRKTYIASYKESNVTRLRIAEHLRKLPMSFFNTKDLSELTTNMMSDCSSMESMLSSTIPPLIANGISVTLTCVLLALFDWRLALCVFITLPIAFLVIWCSRKYQIKLFEKQVETKLNASSQVQEYLEGIKIIKSCNLSGVHFRTLNRALLEMKKIAVKVEMVVGIFMSSASMILQAGIGITIYFFTVAISLSPLGEMCLAAFAGASDIKRVDIKLRVVPLVQYVLDKAKENTSYCPKKVKVKIIHDPAPNAFALGRQTLCITDGLLLLSDDMILGILAHEIGHLSYGHTVIQLLIGGGNIFISGCLLLIKISYWIFSAIMGLFAICSRSGVMGIITAVFAGISTALSWLWVKFCMLFLMWSMRQNEYLADEFAYKIGFGLELATVLDQHISDVPHDGFLSAIYSTHPCNDDRVAALQNLGVPYSRY